uniref:Small ribosomal subunit protein mS29 n=1 Tax=Caligus rogercresseyi TaxID=217165 RepID=C1BP16_CALRO|nr:Mitochondrial 28S ribosomal protein S29 [Caligus rogercresseyi]
MHTTKRILMSSLIRSGFSGFSRVCTRHSSSSSFLISPESNPTSHSSSHKGRLYQVPKDVSPGIQLPSEIQDYTKALGETHLLIRRPALEVFHYLRANKSKKLAVLLFGPRGSGKTSTLSHVAHYGIEDPNLICINFGCFKKWLADFSGEIAYSSFKDGRIDHISQAVEVLEEFKFRNESKISNLLTHREYIWSARESTGEGSPLLDVLNQGIQRPKFSADALNVLMRELLLSCNENKCKVLILGDGINSIFGQLTACHREKLIQERIHKTLYRDLLCVPNELSVIYNLKKLLRAKADNLNIVSSVDSASVLQERRIERHRPTRKRPSTESHLPFALLGEEGWSVMGPFIPVEVDNYSKEELDTMIDFKLEKQYIKPVAGTEAGRAEIEFITGKSPMDFANYCHMW